jgi:hypothetical protein
MIPDPNGPEPVPTGPPPDMDPGDADAQIEMLGATRRREVAQSALAGGDPSTLPSDVQAALVDAAKKLGQATGLEHVVTDIDGAVSLVAAAHNQLLQVGRDDLAGIVDPALLTAPEQAMVLIAGLADPEVAETLNAGVDVPPVDGINETVVGPPEGVPPEDPYAPLPAGLDSRSPEGRAKMKGFPR